MHLSSALSVLLATASLTVASGHGSQPHAHEAIAKRAHENGNHTLAKRYSGQATWFQVGLGACGQWNKPSDFIVALDTPLYGYGSPGPQCFKMITIYGLGKSAVAQIMDECPSCDYGSLDMSAGLFQHFADLGVGEFPITWEYGTNGGDSEPAKTTSKKPAPTTTHHTTTTTTTTTQAATSSTSSSASTSTTEASTTGTATSSSASASSTDGTDGGNIADQQKLVANLGFMISYPHSS